MPLSAASPWLIISCNYLTVRLREADLEARQRIANQEPANGWAGALRVGYLPVPTLDMQSALVPVKSSTSSMRLAAGSLLHLAPSLRFTQFLPVRCCLESNTSIYCMASR